MSGANSDLAAASEPVSPPLAIALVGLCSNSMLSATTLPSFWSCGRS